jgi:hypothetical protein
MTPSILARALIAAPVLAAAAVTGWLTIAEQLELPSVQARRPANIAEAAAAGNAAEVLRRLRFSEDPMRVYPVAEHYISTSVTRATALEAAMWPRRMQLIRLFDDEGAIVGDDLRRELTCLAADLKIAENVEYLSRGERVECEPGLALQRVFRRSSGEPEERR